MKSPPPPPPPRVSVIVPSFNDREYLPDALESIYAQTFTDYEIIVADGGSTDGTIELLNSYNDRLCYFKQSGKGVSQAKNQAVSKAQGEYIAFLDADDLWYPTKLKKQVDLLDSHPEYGFCSADVDFFNEEGICIHGAISTEKNPCSGQVFDRLFVNNFISSATIFLRKECFLKLNGFKENIFYAEDTELWLRIAKEYQLGYIPEALSAYRVRESSRSHQFANHYASLKNSLFEFKQKYPDYFHARPGLFEQALFLLYKRWGYRHFDIGEYVLSRNIFWKALFLKPSSLIVWKYWLFSFFPSCFLGWLRTQVIPFCRRRKN